MWVQSVYLNSFLKDILRLVVKTVVRAGYAVHPHP